MTSAEQPRQPRVDIATTGCHAVPVTKQFETSAHIELLDHLKAVRAEAIEHTRIARQLARERRRIMDQLIAEGFNQTDLARELGVTRQAIQKMIAVDKD
jgi:transcriptional regulator with GAF, ATPase, and Fis domain